MDTGNRVGLALLGLTLLAAGVLALLAAVGVVTVADPGTLYGRLADGARTAPGWTWLAAGIAGVLLTALGVWLVLAEIGPREPTLDEVTLADGPQGRTTVTAAAVERAAARDAARQPGVEDSAARLLADGPLLALRVDLAAGADLAEVRTRLGGVEERVSAVLGGPVTTRARLRPTDAPPPRVQ